MKKKRDFFPPQAFLIIIFLHWRIQSLIKLWEKKKKQQTNISSVGSLFPSLGNAYVLPEAGARCSGGRQHAALLVQLQAQQHFAL